MKRRTEKSTRRARESGRERIEVDGRGREEDGRGLKFDLVGEQKEVERRLPSGTAKLFQNPSEEYQ
jgi:hypothetical protein